MDDTIVAPATVPGTGAISVVRLSGPSAFAVADAVVRLRKGDVASSEGYSLHFGSLMDGDEVLDEAVISVFRAPHSYTGEDSVEISCHASEYVVERLVCLLCEAGARPAEPGEFTRRAFVNGRMDLAQAEAVVDVISASSEAAHRVAMNQLRGGISSELGQMRSALLELTSLMELELDFSEEDVVFADRSRLSALVDDVQEKIGRLCSSFRLGNAIRRGVPVAIVGAANSGKSTLLNALLGEERALVSPVAGTTRDTVEESFNIGGIQFLLIDTAGIRETSDEVESMGISRTMLRLSQADVVLGVVSCECQSGDGDERVSGGDVMACGVGDSGDDVVDGGVGDERVSGSDLVAAVAKKAIEIVKMVDLSRQKLILVLNKIDLSKIEEKELILVVNKNVTDYNNSVSLPDYKVDIACTCAKTAKGVDRVKELVFSSQKARFGEAGATSVLVTNARHYNALCSASRALSLVSAGLASHSPSDLVAQDLREALYYLGTITGEISTDEVLGQIFSNFCIGK